MASALRTMIRTMIDWLRPLTAERTASPTTLRALPRMTTVSAARTPCGDLATRTLGHAVSALRRRVHLPFQLLTLDGTYYRRRQRSWVTAHAMGVECFLGSGRGGIGRLRTPAASASIGLSPCRTCATLPSPSGRARRRAAHRTTVGERNRARGRRSLTGHRDGELDILQVVTDQDRRGASLRGRSRAATWIAVIVSVTSHSPQA